MSLIQKYDGLDSSDDFDDDSSSNQQPLTESKLMQLKYMKDEERNQHHQTRHKHLSRKNNRNIHSRPSVQPIRNIESRYDFDISGSTREDSVNNRYSNENNRRSNPMNLFTGAHLPDIESDSHEENEFSE